jgi:ankyrin repeat protein
MGNVEVVKILLEKGADINKANIDGQTPLMMAVGMGHEEVVEALLEYGANINAKTNEGYTAFDMVYEKEFPEIATLLKASQQKSLVTKNIKEYKRPNIPTLRSLAHSQLDTESTREINKIKDSLSQPGKLGGKRKTRKARKMHKNKIQRGGLSADDLEAEIRSEIFKYPGESRTPERVEELLGFAEDDFNIDELANGYTLLSLAAAHGRLDIVNVLLQHGADPNGANGANWPLRKASENGHLDVVKRLLEVGANPNQTINDTPDFGSHSLAVAAKAGHADVVEVLLEKNAHVRHLDVFGRSSIWYAINNQNYDIAKRLIRAAFLQAPVNGDVYTEENATQDRVLGEENPDVEEYFYKINAIYNQDNDSDITLHPILKDETASYVGGKRKTRTPRKTRKNRKRLNKL